ncbi:hypothetical protein EWM64_g4398 [Hericium alpestre]|uniref:J domain-containing protein n=1 Tax=Hericium alpestre TaxID=135208 RepID=A0A4Y9ZZX9_9AGAM|nr:hypothetical protein EWM64_g4398 [Hericium alpestre]
MPVPVFTTTKNDAYSMLGIRHDASDEDIKIAYKKLALKWHPDRHLNDKERATQRFIEIHDAYRALTTPQLATPDRHHGKKSPGPRHPPMSEEPSSKQTPSRSHRKMPDESPPRRHEKAPDEHERPPPKSPGMRYTTMPDESFPKKSPGVRDATMPEEHIPKKSPGPRYAAMSDEHLPKKSPSPRHTAMPDEHSTRRSPGPRYAAMSDEHSSKKSPGARFATMPDEPPPRKSPGPKHATFADEPRMHVSSSHEKTKHTRHSAPRRHSDTSVPKAPPPPTAPSSSHSSSHSKAPYARSDPGHARGRDHHHKSGHAPRMTRDYSEGQDPEDFSDYVEIDRHDVPLGKPLHPIPPRGTHRSRSEGHRSQSKDWVFPLELTLEDLYHGTSQRFRIRQPSHADGRSQSPTRTVTIIIPAGTQPGARIQALPGVSFEIKEVPHTYYRRVGDDLLMCVELPWSGMDDLQMNGGSISFSGLGGEEVNVPLPETLVDATNGTRVRGKGMPVTKGGKIVEHGDLLIRWDFFAPGKRPARNGLR